jgi:hypothetical protein
MVGMEHQYLLSWLFCGIGLHAAERHPEKEQWRGNQIQQQRAPEANSRAWHVIVSVENNTSHNPASIRRKLNCLFSLSYRTVIFWIQDGFINRVRAYAFCDF